MLQVQRKTYIRQFLLKTKTKELIQIHDSHFTCIEKDQ